MKETGIIMSGNHSNLILDGLKTQTRRTWGLKLFNMFPDNWAVKDNGNGTWTFRHLFDQQKYTIKCPYGQVGDRLYLRESHKLEMVLDDSGDKWVKCLYRFEVDNDGGVRWFRWADLPLTTQSKLVKIRTWNKWRPTRFMYKFLARIWLEITELRAERLQEITAGDCTKEGIPYEDGDYVTMKVFEKFRLLWDSLNAKRGHPWANNDWVWPIGFKL